MNKKICVGLTLAFLLAGCGGGGGASTAPGVPFTPSGSGSGPTSDTGLPVVPASIATTNAVGSTIQSLTAFETSQATQVALSARTLLRPSARIMANGTCNNGVEIFAPDTNGDPNSTEVKDFYFTNCTELARDTVRRYTSTGSGSEIVTTAASQYGPSPTTPVAPTSIHQSVTNLSGATFNAQGYPLAADGYIRSTTGFVVIGSAKAIINDNALVMEAGASSNTFCSDDAGFSLLAVDTNDGVQYSSYGWSSVAVTGSRTVNKDGSVTWTATRQGTDYSGPIGSLALQFNAPDTSCPITSPEFSVSGPHNLGNRTVPVSATYRNGVVSNLQITNASLANGVTLNVTTTPDPPGSSQFIQGTLTNGSSTTPLATFGVDAFGDGTLTVGSGGVANTYVITYWHVMHNPASL